ncbi:MAG: hypothetical protein H7Z16_05620 [Pyrinomonadaceae bacterium]|nr:hypothetical protein [Pyrinomonadaceae bacterium]
MNHSTDLPILEMEVLEGMSPWPPSLTGEELFGVLVAWSDQNQGGLIYLATDQQNPPNQPLVVNPKWTSWDTPAIAIALEWERVYLAWTDDTGAINLANSGDGWDTEIKIAPAGSSSSDTGPALTFGIELLFIAWTTPKGLLSIATCDKKGTIKCYPTQCSALSRPSLAWSDGHVLYALSGGPLNGDDPMRFYFSRDEGQSFGELYGPKDPCLGPPSLVVLNDYFYLVWADAKTSCLNFVVTQNLEDCTAIQYSNACHGGGPALISVGDELNVGWSILAPPEDPTAHHLALGKLPISKPGPSMDKDKYAKREQARAPDPCPDPMSVYDPAQDKCVPKGGCYGACVLGSFMPFGLFNPIKYAACVIACKSHTK